MASHPSATPARNHATVTPHVLRFVVLAVVDVVVRLTLRFQPHSDLLDKAGEFLLVVLVLYWAYCVGVDLFKHFFTAGSEDDDESSPPSARTGMFTAVATTACAAVVLALAAFIGARVRSAGVGGPSLPVMILMLGVVDARVVADALELVARTRRPRARPL